MISLNETTENGNVTIRTTGPTEVPTSVTNKVNVVTLSIGGLLTVRTLGRIVITMFVVMARTS